MVTITIMTEGCPYQSINLYEFPWSSTWCPESVSVRRLSARHINCSLL